MWWSLSVTPMINARQQFNGYMDNAAAPQKIAAGGEGAEHFVRIHETQIERL